MLMHIITVQCTLCLCISVIILSTFCQILLAVSSRVIEKAACGVRVIDRLLVVGDYASAC